MTVLKNVCFLSRRDEIEKSDRIPEPTTSADRQEWIGPAHAIQGEIRCC